MKPSGFTEVGRLVHVAVKHPREAFGDEATVDAQWRALGYAGRPDLGRASAEFDRFTALLQAAGAGIHALPRTEHTTLDSLYARDASIVTPSGLLLGRMGKPARAGEPAAHERSLRPAGVPIAGRIEAPGTLEGGDVVWLDDATLAVGRGYRTNAAGIAQLRAFLGARVDVVEVALPHWRGAGDVMHLMSLLSPVDADLAVVYSPLLPVPFRERLLERMRLVEVPDAEFETMGANVLALGPRRCVGLDGNPATRRALESAGCDVQVYAGAEISVKGAGGPTCLTRPLVREAAPPAKVD